MGKPPRKCPICGEVKHWVQVDKSKSGFSVGKAAVGAALFGPVGLVGGALGKKTLTYACGRCGFQHDYR